MAITRREAGERESVGRTRTHVVEVHVKLLPAPTNDRQQDLVSELRIPVSELRIRASVHRIRAIGRRSEKSEHPQRPIDPPRARRIRRSERPI